MKLFINESENHKPIRHAYCTNFRIEDMDGYFNVVADSNRFGKDTIVFEGNSEQQCIDWVLGVCTFFTQKFSPDSREYVSAMRTIKNFENGITYEQEYSDHVIMNTNSGDNATLYTIDEWFDYCYNQYIQTYDYADMNTVSDFLSFDMEHELLDNGMSDVYDVAFDDCVDRIMNYFN